MFKWAKTLNILYLYCFQFQSVKKNKEMITFWCFIYVLHSVQSFLESGVVQVCKHNMERIWLRHGLFLSHSHTVTQCRDQFQSMPQSSSLEHPHRGFAAFLAWNKELIAAFCFTVLHLTLSSPSERRLLRLTFLCCNIHIQVCTFDNLAIIH